jgi:hypothetical protein
MGGGTTLDLSDERRDEIHALLQEQGPADLDKAAVLVGWAIVCDWSDESGERWLTKAHSASVPGWVAGGYHHEALYGEWPDGDV